MRSVLNGVALGAVHLAEVHNPTVVESDHCLEQEVCVTAACVFVQMNVTDWAEAQRQDPVKSVVVDWLKAQKKTDLKDLLAGCAYSEEG